MTRLITLRRIGATPAGTSVEIDNTDAAAQLVTSGAAIEVSPLVEAGAHDAVRHRAAQEKEEAAVAAAVAKTGKRS